MSSRMSLANLLSSSDSSAPAQRQDEPADMDESELIAAAALRGMRAQNANAASSIQPTPALSLASSASYSTLSDTASYSASLPASTAGSISRASSSRLQLEDGSGPDRLVDGEAEVDSSFLARASKIPIVNSTLRVYENSKNSSRVVKYAAQTVESGVMSVSRPVINRLPVNSLDEFACRQLDRWTPKGKSPTPTSTPTERDATSPMSMDESQDRGRPIDRNGTSGRRRTDSAMDTSPGPPQPSTATPDTAAATTDVASEGQDAQAVAVRSKWQTMITEAGGISAAVSDESMRRLKYCLSWLQYATARIDHQILILREFIAALTPPPGQEASSDTVISPAHLRTLNDVKQDVVKTIRDVVDVVSKYAGGALPEPARATVRAVILHLPQRWATRMQGAPGSVPGTPGPDTSPTASASDAQHLALNGPPTAGVASAAAMRILGLATESLDMMRNVTGVFKDSLDRAETWVERLRVVGIQRQQQGGDPLLAPDGSEPGPSSGGAPAADGLNLPPISTRYRSYPPSEAGEADEHDGSVGASSPVSARLSPSVSLRQLSPSTSTQSIGLGASLDALSLAALQHQAALKHGQQQQQRGPRFTVGPQAASGMDVDDD